MSYRQRETHDGLWWQIALGIFVGQLMTAALGGVVVLLLGGFAANLLTRSTEVKFPGPRTTYRPAPTAPAHRALGDDERCIQGKRFRRLNNGWAELPNDPC